MTQSRALQILKNTVLPGVLFFYLVVSVAFAADSSLVEEQVQEREHVQVQEHLQEQEGLASALQHQNISSPKPTNGANQSSNGTAVSKPKIAMPQNVKGTTSGNSIQEEKESAQIKSRTTDPASNTVGNLSDINSSSVKPDTQRVASSNRNENKHPQQNQNNYDPDSNEPDRIAGADTAGATKPKQKKSAGKEGNTSSLKGKDDNYEELVKQSNGIIFAENEQIKVNLSNRDVNRLAVTDDKIQSINGPAGLYTAKNDPLGAAYLGINSEKSFTIFVTTLKGHQFSLLVKPIPATGKTIVLTPGMPSSITAQWEAAEGYQNCSYL